MIMTMKELLASSSGLSPNLVGNVYSWGLYFYCYNQCKSHLGPMTKLGDNSVDTEFLTNLLTYICHMSVKHIAHIVRYSPRALSVNNCHKTRIQVLLIVLFTKHRYAHETKLSSSLHANHGIGITPLSQGQHGGRNLVGVISILIQPITP